MTSGVYVRTEWHRERLRGRKEKRNAARAASFQAKVAREQRPPDHELVPGLLREHAPEFLAVVVQLKQTFDWGLRNKRMLAGHVRKRAALRAAQQAASK